MVTSPKKRLSTPRGTEGKRVPCGHHGIAVSDSQVEGFTSVRHDSALRADETVRMQGH